MQTKLRVELLEHTPNPDKLVATAAKLCYSKVGIDEIQEKLTQEETDKFIKNLVSMGHESPVEHVSFTFAIEGVSRSLTHQLVRHRLASYSQQSQRYVNASQFDYIVPKDIERLPILKQTYLDFMSDAQSDYDNLVFELICSYVAEDEGYNKDALYHRDTAIAIVNKKNEIKENDKKRYGVYEKRAIENARYILPNACETKIIVTMNVRSLYNFFAHRCCNRAQEEIRDLADAMLELCQEVSPILFKNAGAPCVKGVCPEGKMSCGKPKVKIIKNLMPGSIE